MGLESACSLLRGRKRVPGVALLEPDELIFRGERRLRIPAGELMKAKAEGTSLVIPAPDGDITLRFDDETTAAKWAERIHNPRSRLQKLAVANDSSVLLVGSFEPDFVSELEGTLETPPATSTSSKTAYSHVFLIAEAIADLDRLPALAKRVASAGGCLWVVWPKGRPDFRHEDLVAAASAAGLVQTKSLGFSARYTALRLTRPRTK